MHALINLLMEENGLVLPKSVEEAYDLYVTLRLMANQEVHILKTCTYTPLNLFNGQLNEKKQFASTAFDSVVHYIKNIIIDRDYVNAKDNMIKLCHFKIFLLHFSSILYRYRILPYMSLAYT